MNTDPLNKVGALFASEALPFPSIPAELHGALHELAAWVYGTRTDVPNPYSLAWFVEEVGTRPV